MQQSLQQTIAPQRVLKAVIRQSLKVLSMSIMDLYNTANLYLTECPFLDKKSDDMRLRSLKDTTLILGIHKSTVYRAFERKCLMVLKSVMGLKAFFYHAFMHQNMVMQELNDIKVHLKRVIGQQDERNPPLDRKLVFYLSHQGLDISRRTITKYRASMRMPVISVRRPI